MVRLSGRTEAQERGQLIEALRAEFTATQASWARHSAMLEELREQLNALRATFPGGSAGPAGAALLQEAGVALTPGVDFEAPGSGLGECRVRIGFPGATEDVRTAMRVFREWWEGPTSRKMRGQSA